MYSSLLDAPLNTDLTLLEITRPELASWLQRLGLFVGSHIVRHGDEINYHPVRVRGEKGDVVVPAGLGIKVLVHLDSGERKPLTEMKKQEKGHIETLLLGRGCSQALSHIGIKKDTDITLIRVLPHMDYLILIDKQRRTRLSEGEAARLWGECSGEEATQFYFAKQNKPFAVQEIIGGRKICEHLKTHGVEPGSSLILESIEPTQELHKPGATPVTISSPGGLRIHLNQPQASRIIVKVAAQRHKNHETGQSTINLESGE